MSRKNRKMHADRGLEGLISSLFSFGGRLIFAAVIVLVVLTFSQCTVEKPESPEWNTQFTVPLVNRTYYMPELIRKMDQENIGFDPDSNIVFSISHELDTVGLNADNLATADLNYTVAQTVGKVTMVKPAISPYSANIASIGGLPAFYPAVIPACAFSVVANFPPIESFTSAVIDSAVIYVVVSNNLGIDLDVVNIQLFDQVLWAPIGNSAIPGGIPNGVTDSVPFNLSGRTISNSLSATITCHTPGGAINDPSGKTITIDVRFANDPVVSSATAQLPAFQRVFSDSIVLQESDAITSAELVAGFIDLTIGNSTAVTADILITIPDIRLNGVPLSVTRNVVAFDSSNVSIPLAGYVIEPADQTLPQSLPVNMQADIPGTAPNQVAISESEEFSAHVRLSGLQFGSVTGYFSNMGATIDSIVQEIDVPKGFDSVQFTSAVLTLEIDNGVALPGHLDISMSGNNGKTLPVSGDVAARVLATALTTQIVEPNVATFFSPIPSQVIITGNAGFGNGSLGTIRAGDFMTGRVRIESPLEMIIAETSIETDIANETIDQKDIEKVTDHVLAANFIYNVTNHLPVGATLNILIGADSATLFTAPGLRFDNIGIVAAPVTGGIVNDTISTGVQTISIDSADLQILKNPTLYIAQELILNGTAGQPVRLTKSDYIMINGRIEVEYRFSGSF